MVSFFVCLCTFFCLDAFLRWEHFFTKKKVLTYLNNLIYITTNRDLIIELNIRVFFTKKVLNYLNNLIYITINVVITKIFIKNVVYNYNDIGNNNHKVFLIYTRMSGKNITFNDKKIRKSTFYKNKKVNDIEDINVNNVLVSKKEPYGNKIRSNTLLDIMIMILLGHYV